MRLFKFNNYFLLVLNSLNLNLGMSGLQNVVPFSQGAFFNYHFFSGLYKNSLERFREALN
jgi:hypothetical protein